MDAPPTGPGASGSGEPTPRRRSNGLPSAEWGALVDVDPRLSEPLLARLAEAGVPAYVEPAGGVADPVSRATFLPARPLDRLWIDPSRADVAGEVVVGEVAELGAQEPEASVALLVQPVPRGAVGRVLPPPPLPAAPPAPPPGERQPDDRLTDDERWRQIVEGYGRTAETPVPPWPVAEDLDDAPRRPERPRGENPPPRTLRRRTDDPLPGWVEPARIEDDNHFEPPPPPPVPRLRPRTVAASAALVLGVLLLFTPNLLDVAPGAGTTLLGMLLAGGGAAALVWWMRDTPDDDDGAVV